MFLMVGASVRTMISSAALAGEQAEGLDFFGDIDANLAGKTYSLALDYQLAPTVTNLLQVARDSFGGADLLYLSGPENQPQQLEYWQGRGLLLGNGTEALRIVRDPYCLRGILAEIDAPMPRFYAPAEAPQILQKRHLLKPLNRGGGHGIVDLPEGRPWQERLDTFLCLQKHIIQEYCYGLSASFTFLSDGKQAVLLGASSQWAVEGGFIYRGNLAPLEPQIIKTHPGLTRKMELIANHLTQAAGLVGFNTVDVIINKEGLWVLEVNPRWSASLELFEILAGRSFFTDHVQACRGRLPSPKSAGNAAGFAGKDLVYARRDLRVHYPHDESWRDLYAKGVRDLPRQGVLIAKNQPLCTVLARAVSAAACRKALLDLEQWAWEFFLRHSNLVPKEDYCL
jgi:predicted ATP-grasp superfamily ATP-dependent carboligase